MGAGGEDVSFDINKVMLVLVCPPLGVEVCLSLDGSTFLMSLSDEAVVIQQDTVDGLTDALRAADKHLTDRSKMIDYAEGWHGASDG